MKLISAYFLFYVSNCLTSLFFMRLGTKWHYLLKQIAASELNEYLDLNVSFKCNFATVVILSFAVVEHALSRICKLADVKDCSTDDDLIYEKFVIESCPWMFELGIPYTFATGIYVLTLNTLATIIWSYSHIFIICVSLYLTSVLKQINKRIISRDGQHLPVSHWRKLREDYNRATRLVRSFDDAINSIVFISFASNLFFVCLQLYYLLKRSIGTVNSVPTVECPNYPSGLFNGYEVSVYVSFSLMFVLSRSLAVSLMAAQVHSASLVAAPSLYNVPSSSYGTEIQRFLEQIHGDTVALTGLNFFYITKELVLSVVGTIVTYELVLLQFNQ
ncbi:gustatory receptor for sugar taste 64f-like [Vanessa cardui]|uniref:gustatory receptor for sugar taste 64f-like n=1 Tax=Vanessa cardui TaxID=171605 RepID=UPI001F13F7FD|nr:gustatory receptor for sugar taste 64f-like [Vanessa cardui]